MSSAREAVLESQEAVAKAQFGLTSDGTPFMSAAYATEVTYFWVTRGLRIILNPTVRKVAEETQVVYGRTVYPHFLSPDAGSKLLPAKASQELWGQIGKLVDTIDETTVDTPWYDDWAQIWKDTSPGYWIYDHRKQIMDGVGDATKGLLWQFFNLPLPVVAAVVVVGYVALKVYVLPRG